MDRVGCYRFLDFVLTGSLEHILSVIWYNQAGRRAKSFVAPSADLDQDQSDSANELPEEEEVVSRLAQERQNKSRPAVSASGQVSIVSSWQDGKFNGGCWTECGSTDRLSLIN